MTMRNLPGSVRVRKCACFCEHPRKTERYRGRRESRGYQCKCELLFNHSCFDLFLLLFCGGFCNLLSVLPLFFYLFLFPRFVWTSWRKEGKVRSYIGTSSSHVALTEGKVLEHMTSFGDKLRA